MTIINRSRLAFGIPALIFIACTLITYTEKYQQHPGTFSLAIIADLILIAPLMYFFLIQKTTISRSSVLRVCMAGIVLAGIILSKNNSPVLSTIKTWIAPVIELTLIGMIIWKFYNFKKTLNKSDPLSFDFMMHCRAILKSIFGNEKAANIITSEIGVFYYTFSKEAKDKKIQFTSYKENGIILILATFLCLFMIETAGMHFVFRLWNSTAAWILTGLSLYTCMQLFAHIRALKVRPILLINDYILIRNGLMGGDALIQLDNIERIVKTNKQPTETSFVKIALISGFEKHNLVIHLKEPIEIIKAFGIKRSAKIILVSIDKPEQFLLSLEKIRGNNIS